MVLLNCMNPFLNKALFSRVCSKTLKNSVGKGENARDEQFFLFPWRFETHIEHFAPFLSI